MDARSLFTSVIEDCRPGSLLVAGDAARQAADSWQAAHPDVIVEALDPGAGELSGASAQPHDLALVTDTLESLPLETGRILLGQLRNLGNHQIAVLVSNASEWVFNDFIALGFVRQASTDGDQGHTLYTYNINTYNHKRTWNNPKYWANPEMWDKARW
ncbi:DUF6231 family protein [Marinobacter zhanjiangensis]|uniref:Uncharacterized protein n=1 Tax=Marinobacter zhanjiangensis TaxID=578215 RepID=A0ABQ3AZG3_9GAMM|nr:DUF6231 family protein [Marinobacter zhanjiangensis]GGY72582.1 hypothetical protein GCM10007071_19570 [Marinobacter zhanjiangensis]